MRHIDADELIKALRDGMIDESDWRYESPAECRGVLEWAIAEAEKMPTADVAEVKHGRWIETTRAIMSSGEYLCTELRTICSLCGKEPLYSYWHNEMQSPWCPWCGAKMNEVDNDVSV